MGDHTESVQIDFDPKKISFSKIMDLFWEDHIPWDRSWSKQYQAAVYYHTDSQRAVIEQKQKALEQIHNKKVATIIEPVHTFYIAEDYHQKYYLQNTSILLREFESYFNYFSDFNDSPSVAKVNGLVSGKGNQEDLDRFLPSLALSDSAQALLVRKYR